MVVVWFHNAPSWPALICLLLVTAASGVFVGAVGIGGVLLVPLMLLILDLDPRLAVATALSCFLFGGLTGTVIYARRRCLPLAPAVCLCLGLAPTAAAAAMLLPHVPPRTITIVIASVAIVGGAKTIWQTRAALFRKEAASSPEESDEQTKQHDLEGSVEQVERNDNVIEAETQPPQFHDQTEIQQEETDCARAGAGKTPMDTSQPPVPRGDIRDIPQPEFARRDLVVLFGVGMIVGFSSVMTGTGGPFILVPLLFVVFPDLPAAHVVALGQAAGIPISGCSSVVSALAADAVVDLGLACCVTVALSAGIPVGARVAVAVQNEYLKLSIAVTLVAVGAHTFVTIASG